ncbi:hypothetical protein C1H76_3366 [Elsinoe australis]|uniref:GH64 domain-containing protein n=1 Tax=Elsinoe australis TaxID=40998 RepID=A0A4U7B118_9PEZI|nr:hypothetical protein C1H76_3366 [Elsinoe australis]
MFKMLYLFPIFALLFNLVVAGHTIARPGGAKDIIVTAKDTTNTTNVPFVKLAYGSDSAGQLDLSLTNNLGSNNVNAYVSGLDISGKLVMLGSDGEWYYPTAGTSGIPEPVVANISIPLGGPGTTTNVTLPSYLVSGRVWFADGTLQFFTVPGAAGPALVQPSAANPADPNAAVNWGFVELTNIPTGIWANVSYVDFLGLPLGMTLVGAGGTQTAIGVSADAVTGVCQKLTQRAKNSGLPWDQLCVSDEAGDILRVLSPALHTSVDPTAFKGLFKAYINKVWTRFTTMPLTIDTQTGLGMVNCTVSKNLMTCDGDSTTYAKPTAYDIFGCNSGPFLIRNTNPIHLAVVPRICAAFNRGTLMLPRGNVQPRVPPSRYYTTTPTNFYSQLVKSFEIDGRGYSFSYDDVTPTGGDDKSGLLADGKPLNLAITIGGLKPSALKPSPTSATTTTQAATATASSVRENQVKKAAAAKASKAAAAKASKAAAAKASKAAAAKASKAAAAKASKAAAAKASKAKAAKAAKKTAS